MIADVEWSGILFYDTEGTFGEDDFKAVAKFVLPMNKGSKAYTEFETGDTVVSFLMDNPDYMMCKQGLVHSHGTLAVFFSGEDMYEIKGNSQFHNYYLSLIVNNKGETCAKIASRGKTDDVTTRKIQYTGENGIKKEAIINSTITKDVVFIYNCKVIAPQPEVEEGFKSLVNGIIEKAKKEEAEKATKYKSYSTFNGEMVPFSGKTSSQGDLFYDGMSYSGFTDSSHSADMEGFVSCLVALDILNVKSITKSLADVRKRFGSCKNEKNEAEVDLYCKSVCENFASLYGQYFEDPIGECYMDTLEEVVDIFNEHSTTNWVADELYVALGEELLQQKMIIEYGNRSK